MRTPLTATVTFMILSCFAGVGRADATGKKIDARVEFEKHCASCHPDGGNIMKRDKTLQKKDMDANGITGPGDIVRVMRTPGPGMPAYDAKTIPDREAEEIAEYIWKTFR